MAVYTYKLLTFGLEALTAFAPRVFFIPDQPAFSGGNVLATRRVEGTLAADGAGSVVLVPSVSATPNVTYTMRIEWLNGANIPVGMDVISGLVAALGGGSITEMGGIPISTLWVGPPDPANPLMPLGVTPEAGMWWADTVTGNFNEWI